MGIWDLPASEKDAVELLQGYGIIPNERTCKNSHKMKLYIGKQIFWKCNVEECNQHLGVRTGNWFEGSRISIVTAVRFIYCWCKELTSIKFCAEELGIADKTVIDWNNYMQEICALEMDEKERKQIGDEGLIVEIDENLFVKRKNNTGRVLPQQWVFGGICLETKETFLVTVPNGSAVTLMEKICKNIKEGSIIYSDCWKGYKTSELENAGFLHGTVNHKYNFVDPDTGVHTQHVERMWGSAKWCNKKQRGTARHHLDSYLIEFIWRQAQAVKGEDCFQSVLKAIAKRFPPKK
ncbi:transposase, ISXO2-like domain-containing protein [Trichonephila clavata]|uniref:Transposase, ISXO2-like domain-containing protein n=1 Tax=Trichonephila clavata TaxID=2740835 RepID=A0A8X6FQ79_TRICU|nr:transposase, ISXO2-like domain-containing protein [Trichonephila clavata]